MPTSGDKEEALRRRSIWAYSRTNYLKRHYSAEEWQQANLKRQIRDLTARIQQGQSWLATVPRSDRRYSTWSCKVAELRLKRRQLQAKLTGL